MILHNSKRRSWHHLILTSAVVFGLIQFCQLGQPSAQTLNQAVDSLLANDCQNLTGGGPIVPQFSNELNRLCGIAGFSSAITTGGGAASVQGSAASILNRVLLQRLDQIDEEGKPSACTLFLHEV
jgi:hypothetical protein